MQARFIEFIFFEIVAFLLKKCISIIPICAILWWIVLLTSRSPFLRFSHNHCPHSGMKQLILLKGPTAMIHQPSVIYRMNRFSGLTSPYRPLLHVFSTPPFVSGNSTKWSTPLPLIIYSGSFCISSLHAAPWRAFTELEITDHYRTKRNPASACLFVSVLHKDVKICSNLHWTITFLLF